MIKNTIKNFSYSSQKTASSLKVLEVRMYSSMQYFGDSNVFKNPDDIFLKEEKEELIRRWAPIARDFAELQKIISVSGFGFLFFRNTPSFLIKHFAVVLYYEMTKELRKLISGKEEFVRTFLDEQSRVNYSTIARYIYRLRFLYYLNYPKEFLAIMKTQIPEEFEWLCEHRNTYEIEWDFEKQNFWYYFKSRIDQVLRLIVKYFGLFLSKIRLKSKSNGYMNQECIQACISTMRPGDILLTRQTFVATNLGIPGFWKHMAMYVGTGEYIEKNLSKKTKGLEKGGHYIVESTGKGVCLERFENIALKLDYLAIFRTRFSEAKIHRAIISALSVLHRTYDYLFNYYSDQSFVCSELVTKSYLKEFPEDEGITISLTRIGSGLTYPPNELCRKAAIEKNLPNPELSPVIFIDCSQKEGRCFVGIEDDLFESYKRPRLSFFLK